MAGTTGVVFTPIIPKNINTRVYVNTLMAALNAEAGLHRTELGKTIANWNDAPTMKTEIVTSGNDTIAHTRPTGTENQVKKWRWVNDGTKSHTIKAKNVPTLRFQEGYTPRTKPRKFTSGASRRFGAWVTPKSVKNPGIEAREWTKALAEKRKGPYETRMKVAMVWAAIRTFL